MKKITAIVAVCLSAFTLKAGVLTVSNNTNSPGQYTSLQTAIDSAKVGDTIYVHGSSTSYGNVNIDKRLTLLGTGHNPNKPNPLTATLGTVQFDSVTNVRGASGSVVTGFKVNRIAGFTGGAGTKNLLISRNYFIASGSKISVTGSGYVIQNNIILANNITLNNHPNLIIRNNIFSGAYITTSNQASVLITNNIFLGNSYALFTVSNALVANNIFRGATPKGSNVNTNTFNNNITYQTTYDTIPFGTNSGAGNFVAQDPLFTNAVGNFSYASDYTLQATSPGKNAGTDATDIGIYGGVRPFVDMTGQPAIPQMKYVTIQNSVIPMGDSLRVVIKAVKQQ